MNYRPLTLTEASYMLFAYKKMLRDPISLTPGMKQFYEAGCEALRTKMRELEAGEGNWERSQRQKLQNR